MSKMQNAAVQDRLSNLPDDILVHILSFIEETKHAVRTSILSKRWEKLWVFVPNLFFEHYNYKDDDGAACTSFKNFVHGVLRAHDPSTDISKFRLSYEDCPPEDIASVINDCFTVLFNRGVRELSMFITPKFITGDIFLSTFACETLTSLEITLPDSVVILPDFVSFPNLKFLDIYVTDPDERFVEKLCSSCPVLENFRFLVTTEQYLVINIVSNTLKRLELEIRSSYDDSEITLDAPALEDLSITDDFVISFDMTIRNLTSIEKISIYHHGNSRDGDEDVDSNIAFEFLKGISKVRSLCVMNLSLLELIHPNDEGIMSFGKTTFMNLTYLELDIRNFEGLFIILAKMPNLERTKLGLITNDDDRFSIMPWQTPRLKEIEAWGVEGKECNFLFLMYVLTNAVLLEEMVIRLSGCPSNEERELVKNALLKAARASDECQIRVL